MAPTLFTSTTSRRPCPPLPPSPRQEPRQATIYLYARVVHHGAWTDLYTAIEADAAERDAAKEGRAPSNLLSYVAPEFGERFGGAFLEHGVTSWQGITPAESGQLHQLHDHADIATHARKYCHTRGAAQAIERLVDTFPAQERDPVRNQLAGSLRAVLAQKLRQDVQGGRVALYELLVNTSAAANLIREGKTWQLPGIIQTGQQAGMQNFEQSLAERRAQGRL